MKLKPKQSIYLEKRVFLAGVLMELMHGPLSLVLLSKITALVENQSLFNTNRFVAVFGLDLSIYTSFFPRSSLGCSSCTITFAILIVKCTKKIPNLIIRLIWWKPWIKPKKKKPKHPFICIRFLTRWNSNCWLIDWYKITYQAIHKDYVCKC